MRILRSFSALMGKQVLAKRHFFLYVFRVGGCVHTERMRRGLRSYFGSGMVEIQSQYTSHRFTSIPFMRSLFG